MCSDVKNSLKAVLDRSIEHYESALLLKENDKLFSAIGLGILAIEEAAKCSMLRWVDYGMISKRDFQKMCESHFEKQCVMAAFHFALSILDALQEWHERQETDFTVEAKDAHEAINLLWRKTFELPDESSLMAVADSAFKIQGIDVQ